MAKSNVVSALRRHCLSERFPVNYLRFLEGKRKRAQVMVFAEDHRSRSVKEEIYQRALPVLSKRRRFSHLGLEAVSCSHQWLLDGVRRGKYNKSELTRYFAESWGILPGVYADLVIGAYSLGVNCVGLGPPDGNFRQRWTSSSRPWDVENMGIDADFWMVINTLKWRQRIGRGQRLAVLCGVQHGQRKYPRYVELLRLNGIEAVSLRMVSSLATDFSQFYAAIRKTELRAKRWAVDGKLTPAGFNRYDYWVYVPSIS